MKNHSVLIISTLLNKEGVDVSWKDMHEHNAYYYAKSDLIRSMLFNYLSQARGEEIDNFMLKDMIRRKLVEI